MKKGSSIWKWIFLAGGLFIALLLVIAIFATFTGLRGIQKGNDITSLAHGPMTYPDKADPQKVGQCLDEYMKSVVPSSPLIGYGVTFAQAGNSQDINPALMVAIGQQESALGTAGIVNSHPYNYYGLTKAGGGWAEFSSWEEAINHQATYLKTQYFDQGLRTIPEIGAKYAPVGAGNDPNGLNNNWVTGVQNHFDNIISKCPDLATDYSAGNGSIVEIAQSQIGVSEDHDSCNCGAVQKYGGSSGQPWCAFFSSWVYRQAGYKIPSIGGARALYDWFGANQVQIPKGSGTPQPGDVIYFSYSHVGIVESFDGKMINTIEGNVSTNNVARRTHDINAPAVVGFGRWSQ